MKDALNMMNYAIELLTKFHELELAKVEHPGFNVVKIGRGNCGTVVIVVDNFIPLNEIGVEEGDMFMGAKWFKGEEK